MGKISSIEWTDATVNFWTGCHKVSQGCKNCYMFSGQERWGRDPNSVKRTSPSTFKAALKWKEPRRIFTCSWSDFFIEEADQWRLDAWEIIRKTPQHTWLILTKRPERIKDCLPSDWGKGYENVWLGTTVENQEMADERIFPLMKIPAKVHFLSIEPIQSSVTLDYIFYPKDFERKTGIYGFNCLEPFNTDVWEDYEESHTGKIDWVIVGGESGNATGKYAARPSHLGWYNEIVLTCQLNNTPVFVKQLGSVLAKELNMNDKKGGDIDSFPLNLQVREFPKV